MMLLHNSTYQQQSDFASYCRTNVFESSLSVNIDKVHHYRNLVYNVIDKSLKAAFPLTVNLVTEKEWDILVHDFFSNQLCKSNQVWRMPGEFYKYYETTKTELIFKYPHIIELLLFEWTEVELFMLEDLPYPQYIDNGDWVNDLIAINPEYRLLNNLFPVHRKNARHITIKDKSNYFILMFREKESGRVQFIDISGLFALIIENISKGHNLGEILHKFIPDQDKETSELLIHNTLPFFQRLKEKGFIIGFKQ